MAATEEDLERKIVHLESLFAHQDHLIGELNQLVYTQQQALMVLEKKILALELSQDDSIDTSPRKPPHY